jgi:zinc transport system ATP-binding protein
MHATARTALTVAGLTLDLAGRRILSDVSLTVRAGEFLGLIGPNGGGKTTLLRSLLGLLPPTQGTIAWADGEGGRPRLGYVPQRVGVDAHFPLAAGELVRQGAEGLLPRFGRRRKETQQRGDELLARVGLKRQAATPFVHLSGGQQRRLLLARALMRRPDVLLLDEPTAGVDAEGQEQFCALLRELTGEGLTILLVSHDLPLITAHADRIACLNVTLHWHGRARELDAVTVHAAYRCELQRYQLRQPAPAPPA